MCHAGRRAIGADAGPRDLGDVGAAEFAGEFAEELGESTDEEATEVAQAVVVQLTSLERDEDDLFENIRRRIVGSADSERCLTHAARAINQCAPGTRVGIEGISDFLQFLLTSEERLERGEVVGDGGFQSSAISARTLPHATTKPSDDIVEILRGAESVVTLQLRGEVFRIGIVEKDDANVFDDSVGFVDAVAEIIRLTGSAKTGAGRLLFIKAPKPRLAANDDDVVGIERAIAAPFTLTIGRSFGFLVKQELIEDYVDAANAETFAERTNAHALHITCLAIAEKYRLHAFVTFAHENELRQQTFEQGRIPRIFSRFLKTLNLGGWNAAIVAVRLKRPAYHERGFREEQKLVYRPYSFFLTSFQSLATLAFRGASPFDGSGTMIASRRRWTKDSTKAFDRPTPTFTVLQPAAWNSSILAPKAFVSAGSAKI